MTSNNSTTPIVNNPTVHNSTLLSRAAELGAGLTAVAVVLWVLAGMVSQVWLAWQVPLTAEDLAHASWLGSPTTALHFSSGPMAYMLGGVLVFMGLAMSVAKNTALPALVAIIITSGAYFGAGEAATVRIGILEGVIRIGCYVPETSECRDMLGLPTLATIASRYDPTSPTGDAQWYPQKRHTVVSKDLEQRAMLLSLPGAALLIAPLHFGHSLQLTHLLVQQRAEAARATP